MAGSLVRSSKRSFTLLLAVVYFATHCALAESPAAWWAQRQTASRAQLKNAFASPFALPPAAPRPLSGGKSLPENPLLSTVWSCLPEADGTARRANPITAPGGWVVVHLQDIHRNAEAQARLRAVTTRLIDKAGATLLGVEGAWDEPDLAPFRDFAHADVVSAAADYHFAHFDLSGPLRGALEAKRAVRVAGVDDAVLHRANVDAYRAAAPFARSLINSLAERDAALNQPAALNPGLRNFDAQAQAFHRGDAGLGEAVESLAAVLPTLPPSVAAFQRALELERTTQFDLAEKERAAFLNALAPRLRGTEAEHFQDALRALQSGALSAADFYERVLAWAGGPAASARYPNFARYVRYVRAADALDGEALFADMSAAEDRAYARLARTGDERRRVASMRWCRLARRLVEFTLTRPEWRAYRALPRERGFDNAPGLRAAERFYAVAERRDAVMSNRLQSLMSEQGAGVAVLVTGGFHTAGIDARLRNAGATVVTFVPRVSRADGGAAYLTEFAQDHTPLDEIFRQDKLTLAARPLDRARLALDMIGLCLTAYPNEARARLTAFFRRVTGTAADVTATASGPSFRVAAIVAGVTLAVVAGTVMLSGPDGPILSVSHLVPVAAPGGRWASLRLLGTSFPASGRALIALIAAAAPLAVLGVISTSSRGTPQSDDVESALALLHGVRAFSDGAYRAAPGPVAWKVLEVILSAHNTPDAKRGFALLASLTARLRAQDRPLAFIDAVLRAIQNGDIDPALPPATMAALRSWPADAPGDPALFNLFLRGGRRELERYAAAVRGGRDAYVIERRRGNEPFAGAMNRGEEALFSAMATLQFLDPGIRGAPLFEPLRHVADNFAHLRDGDTLRLEFRVRTILDRRWLTVRATDNGRGFLYPLRLAMERGRTSHPRLGGGGDGLYYLAVYVRLLRFARLSIETVRSAALKTGLVRFQDGTEVWRVRRERRVLGPGLFPVLIERAMRTKPGSTLELELPLFSAGPGADTQRSLPEFLTAFEARVHRPATDAEAALYMGRSVPEIRFERRGLGLPPPSSIFFHWTGSALWGLIGRLMVEAPLLALIEQGAVAAHPLWGRAAAAILYAAFAAYHVHREQTSRDAALRQGAPALRFALHLSVFWLYLAIPPVAASAWWPAAAVVAVHVLSDVVRLFGPARRELRRLRSWKWSSARSSAAVASRDIESIDPRSFSPARARWMRALATLGKRVREPARANQTPVVATAPSTIDFARRLASDLNRWNSTLFPAPPAQGDDIGWVIYTAKYVAFWKETARVAETVGVAAAVVCFAATPLFAIVAGDFNRAVFLGAWTMSTLAGMAYAVYAFDNMHAGGFYRVVQDADGTLRPVWVAPGTDAHAAGRTRLFWLGLQFHGALFAAAAVAPWIIASGPSFWRVALAAVLLIAGANIGASFHWRHNHALLNLASPAGRRARENGEPLATGAAEGPPPVESFVDSLVREILEPWSRDREPRFAQEVLDAYQYVNGDRAAFFSSVAQRLADTRRPRSERRALHAAWPAILDRVGSLSAEVVAPLLRPALMRFAAAFEHEPGVPLAETDDFDHPDFFFTPDARPDRKLFVRTLVRRSYLAGTVAHQKKILSLYGIDQFERESARALLSGLIRLDASGEARRAVLVRLRALRNNPTTHREAVITLAPFTGKMTPAQRSLFAAEFLWAANRATPDHQRVLAKTLRRARVLHSLPELRAYSAGLLKGLDARFWSAEFEREQVNQFRLRVVTKDPKNVALLREYGLRSLNAKERLESLYKLTQGAFLLYETVFFGDGGGDGVAAEKYLLDMAADVKRNPSVRAHAERVLARLGARPDVWSWLRSRLDPEDHLQLPAPSVDAATLADRMRASATPNEDRLLYAALAAAPADVARALFDEPAVPVRFRLFVLDAIKFTDDGDFYARTASLVPEAEAWLRSLGKDADWFKTALEERTGRDAALSAVAMAAFVVSANHNRLVKTAKGAADVALWIKRLAIWDLYENNTSKMQFGGARLAMTRFDPVFIVLIMTHEITHSILVLDRNFDSPALAEALTHEHMADANAFSLAARLGWDSDRVRHHLEFARHAREMEKRVVASEEHKGARAQQEFFPSDLRRDPSPFVGAVLDELDRLGNRIESYAALVHRALNRTAHISSPEPHVIPPSEAEWADYLERFVPLELHLRQSLLKPSRVCAALIPIRPWPRDNGDSAAPKRADDGLLSWFPDRAGFTRYMSWAEFGLVALALAAVGVAAYGWAGVPLPSIEPTWNFAGHSLTAFTVSSPFATFNLAATVAWIFSHAVVDGLRRARGAALPFPRRYARITAGGLAIHVAASIWAATAFDSPGAAIGGYYAAHAVLHFLRNNRHEALRLARRIRARLFGDGLPGAFIRETTFTTEQKIGLLSPQETAETLARVGGFTFGQNALPYGYSILEVYKNAIDEVAMPTDLTYEAAAGHVGFAIRHERGAERFQIEISNPGVIDPVKFAASLVEARRGVVALHAAFTDPAGGGPRLTTEAQNALVHHGQKLAVTLARIDRAVAKVADGGTLQPDEIFELLTSYFFSTKPRFFVRFFRGAQPLKRSSLGGAGMGLAQAAAIVNAAGELRMETRGNTTVFIIDLPVTTVAPSPSAVPEARRPRWTRGGWWTPVLAGAAVVVGPGSAFGSSGLADARMAFDPGPWIMVAVAGAVIAVARVLMRRAIAWARTASRFAFRRSIERVAGSIPPPVRDIEIIEGGALDAAAIQRVLSALDAAGTPRRVTIRTRGAPNELAVILSAASLLRLRVEQQPDGLLANNALRLDRWPGARGLDGLRALRGTWFFVPDGTEIIAPDVPGAGAERDAILRDVWFAFVDATCAVRVASGGLLRNLDRLARLIGRQA
jgi:hypothetical protein